MPILIPTPASFLAAEHKIAPNPRIAAGSALRDIPLPGRDFFPLFPALIAKAWFLDAFSSPFEKSFFNSGLSRRYIADLGHWAAQLRHITHLEKSTFLFFDSMHSALQLRSHIPHETHFDLSKAILKMENLANNPKKAPTGHIVLQYSLPRKRVAIEMAAKIKSANPNAYRATAGLPSTGCTEYIPIFESARPMPFTLSAKSGVTMHPIIFP